MLAASTGDRRMAAMSAFFGGSDVDLSVAARGATSAGHAELGGGGGIGAVSVSAAANRQQQQQPGGGGGHGNVDVGAVGTEGMVDSRLGATDVVGVTCGNERSAHSSASAAAAAGFVPPASSTFQDYAYTSQMFQNRQAMDFSSTNSLQNNNYLYGQSMAAHGMAASQAAAGYMDLAGSLCPPSSSASINQCSRMPPSSVATPMYPWMAIVGKSKTPSLTP